MIKRYYNIILFLLGFSVFTYACPECRPDVESGIYNESFIKNIFIVLLPVMIFLSFGLGVFYSESFKVFFNKHINKNGAKKN